SRPRSQPVSPSVLLSAACCSGNLRGALCSSSTCQSCSASSSPADTASRSPLDDLWPDRPAKSPTLIHWHSAVHLVAQDRRRPWLYEHTIRRRNRRRCCRRAVPAPADKDQISAARSQLVPRP